MTIIASPQGVERAEKALIRLGVESKFNFAKTRFLSRSVITKFFQRQPIQLDSFKKICEELELNWREIAGITEEEQLERLKIKDCSSSDTNEEVEAVQTLRRQVTVIDKQSKEIKAVIILEGDITSVNNDLLITLELFLRTYSGDTIKITDIKEGSIRIIVEGSQEDIERLISQFELRELTEVSGYPVENIQILSESSDDDENNELEQKWRLVQEIVTQGAKGRNLSGTDLSDADLSDANLSRADLSSADLSSADLCGVNLSDANLSDANLSDATLRNAKLRGTNLSRADLSGADLSGTTLRNANLSGADLIDANLSGADLRGANLSDATLRNANLSGADLSGANLSGADLSVADLSGADLSGADLSEADLFYANLSGADLIDAKLSVAKLSVADLSRADLSRADLSRADLFYANLEDAIVVNALFGGTVGLTEDMKRDLEQRGAIFGDRPPVSTPK